MTQAHGTRAADATADMAVLGLRGVEALLVAGSVRGRTEVGLSWPTLMYRGVTLRARWVTLNARWVAR